MFDRDQIRFVSANVKTISDRLLRKWLDYYATAPAAQRTEAFRVAERAVQREATRRGI